MAAPTKIMVMRHAEKPYGKNGGIDEHGQENKECLIVRGWQRAGGLVALFDPSVGPSQSPNLSVPTAIYASKPVSMTGKGADHKVESKSKRPHETIKPLAERLGFRPSLHFELGQEKELVDDALTRTGIVLICWQHQAIPKIAKHIVATSPPNPPYPASWPGDRFDIVWVFTPPAASSAPWDFVQVPQQLLAGDTDAVISLSPAQTAA